MTAGLLALLLAPFAGAALAPALGARFARAALAATVLLALALLALLALGRSVPAAIAVAWVPALGLDVSALADVPSLAAAAACLALGLARLGRVAQEKGGALALVAVGCAQALALGAGLASLAGGAALAALVAFALEDRRTADAAGRAGWTLLVRLAGALALLAAALIATDVLGSAEFAAIAAAAPADRAQPLFWPALGLALFGVLALAGAWPWRGWLWREARGAPFADPLLALVAAALALRLAGLAAGALPRGPLALGLLGAALALPLVAAVLGRLAAGGGRPAGGAA